MGGAGRGAAGDGRAALGDGNRTDPGDDYLDRLLRHLSRYKRFPQAARDRKEQGDVVVAFTILRDGTLLDPAIDRSSGYESLDRAAIDMLRRASPAPPLPASYARDSARVVLPVEYSLSFINRLF